MSDTTMARPPPMAGRPIPATRRRTPKRVALMLTTVMIGALSGSLAVQPAASAGTLGSAGPLSAIAVTPDLNCAVNHVADPSNGAFYNNTACGTFVAVNGTLFGPAFIPAGAFDTRPEFGDLTPFTPVSQSAVTGTGTAALPFTIVTVVDLGTTGLRLTETDTYTVGQETYRTDVHLANNGTGAVNALVYRAGDCSIHGSDDGYGMVGPDPGSIACTTKPAFDGGGELVRWTPITTGSHYRQGRYDSLWTTIRTQQPFANSCLCTDYPQDDGAGLSWSVTVPGNGATDVSSRITFSLGAVQTDLSVTLNDSPDPVAPGANLSYTTIVTNAGPGTASGVNVSIETPASTSFVSLPRPEGWAWTCTTPLPGGRGPVACNRPSLAVGAPQVITLVVKVDPGPEGLVEGRASVSSSTADSNQANNSDTETTTVAAIPPVAATDRMMAVGLETYLPGPGGATLQAKPDDIVRFSPAANNTYSMVFQGDDVGLTGATIDALAVDPVTKDLILSFTQSRTVTGIGTVPREDLVAFHPTSLGATTLGTFRLFFDGSDIGLTAGTDENIDAVDVGPDGKIYFSTQGPFDIKSGNGPRRTGNDKDIVACTPSSLGNSTACSALSTYRLGSSLGLTTVTEDIDAFDLTANGEDLISTTDNYDVPGSAGYGTDALTCKAGTCSRFFVGTNHYLLRLADIETGTLLP